MRPSGYNTCMVTLTSMINPGSAPNFETFDSGCARSAKLTTSLVDTGGEVKFVGGFGLGWEVIGPFLISPCPRQNNPLLRVRHYLFCSLRRESLRHCELGVSPILFVYMYDIVSVSGLFLSRPLNLEKITCACSFPAAISPGHGVFVSDFHRPCIGHSACPPSAGRREVLKGRVEGTGGGGSIFGICRRTILPLRSSLALQFPSYIRLLLSAFLPDLLSYTRFTFPRKRVPGPDRPWSKKKPS